MVIHQIERDPSAFQQPVPEADLREQLTRELAGEKVLEVVELGDGLFNNTYRVRTTQNAYILKVAPVREADILFLERDLMQRERTLAPQLQSLSPLVPEYLSFFTIGDREAFLQPLIEGRLWHEVISSLSEEENAELWRQLGAFARTVHGCGGSLARVQSLVPVYHFSCGWLGGGLPAAWALF